MLVLYRLAWVRLPIRPGLDKQRFAIAKRSSSNENTTAGTLQIAPNPARGEIRIWSKSNHELKSKMVPNMPGHVVFRQHNACDVLNIAGLPAAVYVVEVPLSNVK